MRIKTKMMMALAVATFAVVACSDRNDANVAPAVDAGPATAADRSYAEAADTKPKPAEADNTGRNVRDRNDETLTPGDQSNSAPDVALTQTIRKGITSDDTMSVQARNVKVITQDGVVTLRGPVETQQEKQSIETLAKNAGATRIDNQIEIDRDAPGDEE
jgi:osmotically-inducible protein OsmY